MTLGLTLKVIGRCACSDTAWSVMIVSLNDVNLLSADMADRRDHKRRFWLMTKRFRSA
jgi:hypothetical protein